MAALFGITERFGWWVSSGAWALLWTIYLSFVNVGQTFYAFGWESMLLEAGFLAIFLGPRRAAPSAIPMWLLRWMQFRVMLGAGLIKLRGDTCWTDLTCLDRFYATQTMPNPLSWYFHQLPEAAHRGGVLFNHFAELIVPFAFFLPQRWSTIASRAGIFRFNWPSSGGTCLELPIVLGIPLIDGKPGASLWCPCMVRPGLALKYLTAGVDGGADEHSGGSEHGVESAGDECQLQLAATGEYLRDVRQYYASA